MDLARSSPLPPVPVPALDRFAERAARLLAAPVALVSLVDVHGQNLPGACGLPEPWNSERWTPLSHSFCQHVVRLGRPLAVANADDDPLVADNGAVMDLGVIVYLGVPLVLPGSEHTLAGALCAIDHQPRQWSPDQIQQLTVLAGECSLMIGAAAQDRLTG